MKTKSLICAGLALATSSAFAGVSVIGYSVMSNGDDHLYQINFSTGLATDLGLVNFGDAEAMTMGPGGTIYAAGGTVHELVGHHGAARVADWLYGHSFRT